MQRNTIMSANKSISDNSSIMETSTAESSMIGSLSLPPVKLNISQQLQTLSRVAARSSDEEDKTLVDLDSLQLDLETLLSHCNVMRRGFHNSVEALNESDGTKSNRKKKRTKLKKSLRYCHSKRKVSLRPQKINVEIIEDFPCSSSHDKTPVKIALVNGGKTPLKFNSNPTINGGKTPNKSKGVTKGSSLSYYVPKNNSAELFWHSVKGYVDDVSDVDVKLLEDMLKVYDNDNSIPEIPALGEHYTKQITDKDQNNFQKIKNRLKKLKTNHHMLLDDNESLSTKVFNRSEQIVLNDNILLPNNLFDKIVSAINTVIISDETKHENNEIPNLELIQSQQNQKINSTNKENATKELVLSTRRRSLPENERIENNETQDETVQTNGDAADDDEEEDEILNEINKCKSELNLCCNENKYMLNNLYKKISLENKKNKLKNKINSIDLELTNLIKKLIYIKNNYNDIIINNSAQKLKNRSNDITPCKNLNRSELLKLKSETPRLRNSEAALQKADDLALVKQEQNSSSFEDTSSKYEIILKSKINKYKKRILLYIKMRDCLINILENNEDSVLNQFNNSMDIDTYLLQNIIEHQNGVEIEF